MSKHSTLSQLLDSFTPRNAIRARAMREYCLIEGTADSLRFLASLLLAVADSAQCDFRFSPFEAGHALLTADSTRGLWIHRLPCKHGPMDVRRPRVSQGAPPPAPAKFGDIYKRGLSLWPEQLDLSDGYLIKETSGYYSRTLSEAWSDAEDRVDPTNEWDALMVWTLYRCLHEVAKRAHESGTVIIRPAEIPARRVRAAYLRALAADGYEKLRDIFLASNPNHAP